MSNALCRELDFVGSKLLHMFVFAIGVAASHNGLRHKWILFRRNVLYHHHPKMQLQSPLLGLLSVPSVHASVAARPPICRTSVRHPQV